MRTGITHKNNQIFPRKMDVDPILKCLFWQLLQPKTAKNNIAIRKSGTNLGLYPIFAKYAQIMSK